mgnify:CR=1 FL=1
MASNAPTKRVVTDGDAQPVAGLRVYASYVDWGNPTWRPKVEPAVTDAKGAFLLEVANRTEVVDLLGALNRDGLGIEDSPVSAQAVAGLLDRIKDNTISGKIAKEVFEAMWSGEGTADEIIEAKGLKQITDSSAIEAVVDKVIAANPSQVAEYKAGKDKLIGYFVGQVMKETKGQANPGQVNKILKEKLSN